MIEMPRPPCTRLDLIAAKVHAATGTRNALQVADDSLVVGAVLQVHAQHLQAVLFGRLVVGDVALFLQDAGDLGLQLGGGHVKLLVARADGVADARQKVGYWIGEVHSFSFIPRSLGAVSLARTSGNVLLQVDDLLSPLQSNAPDFSIPEDEVSGRSVRKRQPVSHRMPSILLTSLTSRRPESRP